MLPPMFGAVELTTAWEDDPFVAEVQGGGAIRASEASPGCAGWIANRPDYWVQYRSLRVYDLTITARSEDPVTLVINLPNGEWYCTDGSNGVHAPIITLDNATSGVYSIWVGSFSPDSFPEAQILISEHGTTRVPL